MESDIRVDLYHGVFRWHALGDGTARVTAHADGPNSIPDPETGRSLRIATIDAGGPAICPACAGRAEGGFVSFVADLRLAYACPQCRQLIWTRGA